MGGRVDWRRRDRLTAVVLTGRGSPDFGVLPGAFGAGVLHHAKFSFYNQARAAVGAVLHGHLLGPREQLDVPAERNTVLVIFMTLSITNITNGEAGFADQAQRD